MSTHNGAGRNRGWGSKPELMLLFVAAVMLGACAPQTRSASDFGIAIPPDPSSPEFQRAAIEYGDSLTFMTHSVMRGTSDKQYLETVDTTTSPWSVEYSGCVGHIMPEEDAHSNHVDRLKGEVSSGEGRITVAFELMPDATKANARCEGWYLVGDRDSLQVPPGRSYVWVAGLRDDPSRDSSGTLFDTAIAYVIPVDIQYEVKGPFAIRVCRHPEYSWNHSLARWTFDESDAQAWWKCGRNACCSGG